MDLGDVLRLGRSAEAEPPPNDIDATGRCCCGGCIGMGPCDEGIQVDDVYVIGRPVDVVELPEKDVT